jgi:mono/diheme cytochrome c family protein
MRFNLRPSRDVAAVVIALISLSRHVHAEAAGDMDQGEYMARASNCAACHTAPGGKPFAGGLPMMTPLGVIFTTNITPDPATGVGLYSLEEFGRALRQGIAKDGHHLYPAMPYPSYARLTDEDVRLLYGYFQKSVAAVDAPNQPGKIKWPLNMRWPLALWNLVFNRASPFQDASGTDPAWRRGAYLVQGPGHCGACHTPRGIAFQEKSLDESGESFLSGATLDNWSAPNLRGDGRAGLGRWSKDDLMAFLKGGHNRFGSSFGTMNEVVNGSTQYLRDDDIAAMAKYLKALPSGHEEEAAYRYSDNGPKPAAGADGQASPAMVYSQRCGSCHSDNGKGQNLYIAPLAGNPSVMDPDPTSLINIVLNGSIPLFISGVPDLYKMPQFRRVLSDQEIADIVSHIRASWGNDTQGVTARDVGAVRAATDFVRYKSQILTMQ